MPEGPEVRTLVDQLQKHLISGSGKVVAETSPFLQAAQKRKSKWTQEFNFPIGEFTILKIDCKGKLIVWHFESQEKQNLYYLNHLAMTGGLSTSEIDGWLWKIKTANQTFYYYDHRKFGKFIPIDLFAMQKELSALGPDILSDPPNEIEFLRRLLDKRKNICALLMDQSVFCGIGNYIKNEALYAAKIFPYAAAKNLPRSALLDLRVKLIEIAQKSYQMQGATLSTFRNLDDKPGEFAQFLKVYHKKTDPNGYTVLQEKTPDQRTTHWVEEVQTIGR